MGDPFVSIVIPVFNGSNYLKRAIDSALTQSYRNTEIVIVNDGSTDGGATEEIARSYGDKIRYYYKENGGVATALNLAVSVMHGEYFSWLSHDDEYLPNKVQAQVDYLRQLDNDNSVVYSGFEVIDANSNKLGTVIMPMIEPVDFRYWITRGSMLHGCSLLIPKKCFARSGLFDPRLRTTQDYDLWFRMSSSTSFLAMPNPLIRARSHEEQGTKTLGKVVLEECDELHSRFFKQLIVDGYFSDANPTESVSKLLSLITSFKERGFTRAYRLAVESAFRELKGFSLPRRIYLAASIWGVEERGAAFRNKIKGVAGKLARSIKIR